MQRSGMVFGDESGENAAGELSTYNVMEARRLLCAFYRAAFTMTAFTACKLTSAFGANGMLGLNAPVSCLLRGAARR